MSEEVKILYVKTLAAQSLVGGQADPKKIADIYLFMSQIDLQPDGRVQVRQFLEAGETGPSKVLELASKTVVKARSSRDEIAFSLVKDMVRVSRVGGGPSQSERESIVEIAVEFGYDADKAISLAEKAIEQDEAFVEGEVTIGELEKRSKQLAAQAASLGVPIAAVYVSGSVVGLSAAGITSGLAWLGLGGLLGLSSMLTGIGVVILIGAATHGRQRAGTQEAAGTHDPGGNKASPEGDSGPGRRHKRHRREAGRVHVPLRPERGEAHPVRG